MVEGVNSSMIYCKNFCKCHNVPPGQQLKEKHSLGGASLTTTGHLALRNSEITYVLCPSDTHRTRGLGCRGH
jgi:NAD-dependent dihydropyrimidine dehydrogenase PreA subunit